MKKKYIIIAVAAILLIACAVAAVILFQKEHNDAFKNKITDSLPKYESAVLYQNSGTAKLIQYGKYTYSGVTDAELTKNQYLKKIDLETLDIAEMDALMDSAARFDLLLGKLDAKDSASVADVTANFDFDFGSIGAPNYFYVETVTGGKTDESPAPESCDEIYIYYFDIEAQILYYFYVNQKEINKTVAD